MIIVDTSVWMQAFNVDNSVEHREVDRLLAQRNVAMVGIVLAEILQGARNVPEFERLQEQLTSLPYCAETQTTWTKVGNLSYGLKRRGLTVGIADLLIGSLAIEYGHQVYSLDEHFQRIPSLKLHLPSSRGRS